MMNYFETKSGNRCRFRLLIDEPVSNMDIEICFTREASEADLAEFKEHVKDVINAMGIEIDMSEYTKYGNGTEARERMQNDLAIKRLHLRPGEKPQ